jgi:hypothetical protein
MLGDEVFVTRSSICESLGVMLLSRQDYVCLSDFLSAFLSVDIGRRAFKGWTKKETCPWMG